MFARRRTKKSSRGRVQCQIEIPVRDGLFRGRERSAKSLVHWNWNQRLAVFQHLAQGGNYLVRTARFCPRAYFIEDFAAPRFRDRFEKFQAPKESETAARIIRMPGGCA